MMSRKMEYTGKDVDQAIKAACEALSATSDQLDVEVISAGSTGIFGLCRRKATIMASLKVPEGCDKPGEGQKKKRQGSERTGRRQGAGTDNNQEGIGSPSAVSEGTETAATTAVDNDEEHGAGDPAASFPPEIVEVVKSEIMTFFSMIHFQGTCEAILDDNGLTMKIDGDRIEDIIGSEGQILDSIQYLLRKMVSKRLGKKIMFSLDAGNYRALRLRELETLALRLASSVKASGKSSTITALNPADRRVIHMTLQKDTEIRSRSLGDGIYKRILIFLPGKPGKNPQQKSGRGGRGRRKPAATAKKE